MGEYEDEDAETEEEEEEEPTNPEEEYDPDIEPGRVAEGALLMDKLVPGWYKHIDLVELDMSSGIHCLLGQTFGTKVEQTLVKKLYPEEYKAAKYRLGFPNERHYGY